MLPAWNRILLLHLGGCSFYFLFALCLFIRAQPKCRCLPPWAFTFTFIFIVHLGTCSSIVDFHPSLLFWAHDFSAHDSLHFNFCKKSNSARQQLTIFCVQIGMHCAVVLWICWGGWCTAVCALTLFSLCCVHLFGFVDAQVAVTTVLAWLDSLAVSVQGCYMYLMRGEWRGEGRGERQTA